MVGSKYGEDALVEQPAMSLLAELGWDTLSGFDEHPGSGGPIGRGSFTEAILEERLRRSMRVVNPGCSDSAIDQAVETLARDRSVMQPVRANHDLWQLLRDGFAATVTDAEGNQQTERVQYIHWTASDRNEFVAINQFWVTGPLHRRRTDIVLFVNGIPLVLVELKASHDAAEDGVPTRTSATTGTPSRNCSGRTVSSSSPTAARRRSAPRFAGWEHFADWKQIDERSRGRARLPRDDAPRHVRPDRLLDLVENFTAFQEQTGGLVKMIAKNHQYLGVNNAIEALASGRATSDGRLGVFWHTQGSGKSLSMIFFTQKVLRKVPGQLDLRDGHRPAASSTSSSTASSRTPARSAEAQVQADVVDAPARAAHRGPPLRLHADPQVPQREELTSRCPCSPSAATSSSSPTRRTAASTTRSR